MLKLHVLPRIVTPYMLRACCNRKLHVFVCHNETDAACSSTAPRKELQLLKDCVGLGIKPICSLFYALITPEPRVGTGPAPSGPAPLQDSRRPLNFINGIVPGP